MYAGSMLSLFVSMTGSLESALPIYLRPPVASPHCDLHVNFHHETHPASCLASVCFVVEVCHFDVIIFGHLIHVVRQFFGEVAEVGVAFVWVIGAVYCYVDHVSERWEFLKEAMKVSIYVLTIAAAKYSKVSMVR